ncbi:MAG: copper resistance protein CopB [Alteromonadaceae bacterium]|nr:MAG: copper resistance protein CopB [Alteromonadaceae bacterium]
MKITTSTKFLKTVTMMTAFTLACPSLWAQKNSDSEAIDHSAMDHSKMDHSKMDHSKMDHSKMGEEKVEVEPAKTMSMDMNMQGGDAPPNARDPHAYSGGYTLTDGPYAQDGPRQLKLADEHVFKHLLANRFEYDGDSETTLYDLQGWIGTTYDRLVVKTEGEVIAGSLAENQTDILWGHAVSTFWDAQLGVRVDSSDEGESRQWLAVGIQGLAPYWFELDIAGYVDIEGRTALAIEAEYELLLTQRLILQPRAEMTVYGKNDEVNGVGQGLATAALGVRLRYEITRQFAPYAGVEWTRAFGNTADFANAANEPLNETRYVAGVRFWF